MSIKPEIMLGGLGATEIIIVAGLLVLLFGAKKIPDMAKGLGEGIREFKKVSSDLKEEVETSKTEKNSG